MNTQPNRTSPSPASDRPDDPPQRETSKTGEPAHAPSASTQATREASKGDPLPAANKAERSPKQENL